MFVSIEGLDGSGTTTLTRNLSDIYSDSVTTCEPTGNGFGKMVRDRLSDDERDPLIDFYLFMCDRRAHIESVIKPTDKNEKLVISDRYADSTRAYQPVSLSGEGDDTPFDSSWEAKFFIEHTMNKWNYEPDLTLYLDVDIDTALERSDGLEKYENRAFLEKVKRNYDAIAEQNERVVAIDGSMSEDVVLDRAVEIIDNANS